jgi:hypothetical protein
MKKINFKVLTFVILFASSLSFIGCSNNEQDAKHSDASLTQRGGSQTDSYLTSFYHDTFQYGNSIETTENNVTYEVTEVIVGSDTTARGYVIVEKSSNSFLYFVDVNRNDYVLTSTDIALNQTKVTTEINKNVEYSSTDEFDFIQIIDEFNSNPTPKKKFWGWSAWEPVGPCTNHHQTMVHTHYVLFQTNVIEHNIVPC